MNTSWIAALTNTAPIGTAAVGDALGHRHQVGRDVEARRRERRAEAAEAGDDLVEDQQDAVLVADRAQPLEVALGRDQHAGRAGHRLDDHRGDGRRIVQRDDALEIVGQLGAVLRYAARERVARKIVRVAQVVDADQHRRRRSCGCRPCRRPRCRRSRRRDNRARGRSGGCACLRRAPGDRPRPSSAPSRPPPSPSSCRTPCRGRPAPARPGARPARTPSDAPIWNGGAKSISAACSRDRLHDARARSDRHCTHHSPAGRRGSVAPPASSSACRRPGASRRGFLLELAAGGEGHEVGIERGRQAGSAGTVLGRQRDRV